MKFTRLRLLGFKSFVEPADFLIEPGLTGVVGPNGCGKSNLVEALRWVMGESSYKNMRATGMDDVIFGGSANRPARNTAEVTLFADNAERTAPASFNDSDQLEITRRIEREAGSAYKINARDCRARDVQLLFADASTGARSPSMVGQGRIGELISQKPQQRRAILEEAAGISGLHTRRHEAELRLRAAEQNLDRLEDILGQITAQLDSLKRQARQATRYRNLSSEIRKAEAALFLIRYRSAGLALKAAQDAAAADMRLVAERTEQQGKTARDQAVVAHKLPALRQAEAAAAAILQRLKVAERELESEDKRVQERLTELDRRIAQLKDDIQREESLASENSEILARLTDEEKQLKTADKGADKQAADVEARLEAASRALGEREQALNDMTRRLAELEARKAQLQKAAQDAGSRVERATGQLDQVDRDCATIEQQLAQSSDLQEKRSAVAVAEGALQDAETRIDTVQKNLQAARDAETGARQTLSAAERELDGLLTEAKTIARILQVDNAGGWSPVVDDIRADSGFETALGAALGDDLDAPLDSCSPLHWRAIAPLADDPLLPQGVTALSDHVSAPDALKRALSQIGLVETAEDGDRLHKDLKPGQKLVTRDGAVWRWDGLVAAADAPTAAAQRLAHKNRLTDLDRQAEASRATVDGIKQQHLRTVETVRAAQDDERTAREARRRCQSLLGEAQAALTKAERAQDSLQVRLTALKDNRAHLLAALDEAHANQKEAEEARAALADPGQERAALETGKAEVAQQRAALSEIRAELDGLKRETRIRRDRLQAIERERQSWKKRAANASAQVKKLRDRITEAETERTTLAERPEAISGERRKLFREIEAAEIKRTEASNVLSQAELELMEADRLAKEASTALSSARETAARSEEKVVGAQTWLHEIIRQIAEALECRPDALYRMADVAEADDLPTEQQVDDRLARLKSERERLGGVNLRAEEEAQEVSERIETMTKERDDLIEAIRRLRQGIQSLNKEGRERLLAAFETVNDHFESLFTRLFGGGTAQLKLVESDDPLEAGLEIIARPPGKKPQSLTLLSGGEQALTATALIFAVFLTNPSPICVLDEVDAPLDDANVERYCNLLDEMARETETRFIVITHNPITMARMNRLFGVTMAERGISQLVSVDLETAESFRDVG
ncbi:chromosome segregation protein SMC [Coralliovum pocilloporae]|uniref:chromosome segregation protein SMC n=1 Tax=Coralliovum pocilloporae TaxID=3066369 RepID=UPI003307146A